jgi:hypothetical protein
MGYIPVGLPHSFAEASSYCYGELESIAGFAPFNVEDLLSRHIALHALKLLENSIITMDQVSRRPVHKHVRLPLI